MEKSFKNVIGKLAQDESLEKELESLNSLEDVYNIFVKQGYDGDLENFKSEASELLERYDEIGKLSESELKDVAGGVTYGKKVLAGTLGSLMMSLGAVPGASALDISSNKSGVHSSIERLKKYPIKTAGAIACVGLGTLVVGAGGYWLFTHNNVDKLVKKLDNTNYYAFTNILYTNLLSTVTEQQFCSANLTTEVAILKKWNDRLGRLFVAIPDLHRSNSGLFCNVPEKLETYCNQKTPQALFVRELLNLSVLLGIQVINPQENFESHPYAYVNDILSAIKFKLDIGLRKIAMLTQLKSSVDLGEDENTRNFLVYALNSATDENIENVLREAQNFIDAHPILKTFGENALDKDQATQRDFFIDVLGRCSNSPEFHDEAVRLQANLTSATAENINDVLRDTQNFVNTYLISQSYSGPVLDEDLEEQRADVLSLLDQLSLHDSENQDYMRLRGDLQNADNPITFATAMDNARNFIDAHPMPQPVPDQSLTDVQIMLRNALLDLVNMFMDVPENHDTFMEIQNDLNCATTSNFDDILVHDIDLIHNNLFTTPLDPTAPHLTEEHASLITPLIILSTILGDVPSLHDDAVRIQADLKRATDEHFDTIYNSYLGFVNANTLNIPNVDPSAPSLTADQYAHRNAVIRCLGFASLCNNTNKPGIAALQKGLQNATPAQLHTAMQNVRNFFDQPLSSSDPT